MKLGHRQGRDPAGGALRGPRHFRAITGNGAVIYGRRTLLDFPGGKPLPGRCNAVLTRRTDFSVPGAIVCRSPQAAILATQEYEDCFVIGGESVYRQMLPYCRRVFLTRIYLAPACDAFFPDLDASEAWEITLYVYLLEETAFPMPFSPIPARNKKERNRQTLCWKSAA